MSLHKKLWMHELMGICTDLGSDVLWVLPLRIVVIFITITSRSTWLECLTVENIVSSSFCTNCLWVAFLIITPKHLKRKACTQNFKIEIHIYMEMMHVCQQGLSRLFPPPLDTAWEQGLQYVLMYNVCRVYLFLLTEVSICRTMAPDYMVSDYRSLTPHLMYGRFVIDGKTNIPKNKKLYSRQHLTYH